MSGSLKCLSAGPAVTVQDLGRPGNIGSGLPRGGAMDRLALYEAAALLQQTPGAAAIEMIGTGGRFEVDVPLRIALTGAPMQAKIDGAPVTWHACHTLPPGSVLEIGSTRSGTTGYLSVGGGIDTPRILGSRAAHLSFGIGCALQAGDSLPLLPDPGGPTGMHISPSDRFSGGAIHIVRSFQSALFGESALDRFAKTGFVRDARGNRQGIRFNPEGEGFAAEGGLTVLSEIITTGDIQITGDGAPYVLMAECQTTGGYPRIATVLPSDLPRVAQAPVGSTCRFVMVDRATAIAREQAHARHLAALPGQPKPLLRDPADIHDLLGYELVSGVVSATDGPLDRSDT